MMILYHHHFVHRIEQQMEPRTRIEKRTGKRPGVLRQLLGDDELLLDCRIQRLKSDQSRNSSFYEEVERTDLERCFFYLFGETLTDRETRREGVVRKVYNFSLTVKRYQIQQEGNVF